jgi:beta-1,4-mannosyl-glycoprotein beta-1,4-N-acetylglucosaminyltransferase
MFNDELDILELRLGQLDSVVDYFVFNEMSTTHSGKEKPLHYQSNKDRFSKWNHKIVCRTVSLSPAGAWELETKQRRELEVDVLRLNPRSNDTLSTSDCDEIPNPEVLKKYSPQDGLRNLKQFTFWYNFSHLFNYGSRTSSRARLGSIQHMLDAGGLGNFHGGPKDDMDPNFPSTENAGWHCSYFTDDISRLRRKVNSFAHTDLAPYINGRTDKQLAEVVYNGRDLYGRAEIGDAQRWEENDSRLPSYFLDNKEKFSAFTNSHFHNKYKTLLEHPETGAGVVAPQVTHRLPRAPKR